MRLNKHNVCIHSKVVFPNTAVRKGYLVRNENLEGKISKLHIIQQNKLQED